MPPATRKRPGDLTGRQAEVLAAEKKEELEKRAEEISLTQQAEQAIRDEVIDLTEGATADNTEDLTESYDDEPGIAVAAETEPVVKGAALRSVTHSPGVHVERPNRTFRVNSNIEQMTYGTGTSYDFKEGYKYTAPADLYEHLDRLGYIYH